MVSSVRLHNFSEDPGKNRHAQDTAIAVVALVRSFDSEPLSRFCQSVISTAEMGLELEVASLVTESTAIMDRVQDAYLACPSYALSVCSHYYDHVLDESKALQYKFSTNTASENVEAMRDFIVLAEDDLAKIEAIIG